MNQAIRILIVDNDVVFAYSLQRLLEQNNQMQVVAVVRDGASAITSCLETQPDVVLLDLHLPDKDSISTIQRLLAWNEHLKILTTSPLVNDPFAIEAVKLGAGGYVDKTCDEKMVNTIRQVAGGDVAVNPALAASILEEFHNLIAQD
jgi:DNA-binding NarL/FixJ family response regulator